MINLCLPCDEKYSTCYTGARGRDKTCSPGDILFPLLAYIALLISLVLAVLAMIVDAGRPRPAVSANDTKLADHLGALSPLHQPISPPDAMEPFVYTIHSAAVNPCTTFLVCSVFLPPPLLARVGYITCGMLATGCSNNFTVQGHSTRHLASASVGASMH